MNWIKYVFGEGESLNELQMCCRAIVAFFVALVLIRIAGQRTFGKRSAMDNVVMIMLGAVLSRAVVGASPMVPVILACTAMSLIHRVLAWLSLYSDTIGRIVKGNHHCLYRNGEFRTSVMKKQLISEKDLMEGVRLQINNDSLDDVDKVFIERSGDVSVVKKKEKLSGTEFFT